MPPVNEVLKEEIAQMHAFSQVRRTITFAFGCPSLSSLACRRPSLRNSTRHTLPNPRRPSNDAPESSPSICLLYVALLAFALILIAVLHHTCFESHKPYTFVLYQSHGTNLAGVDRL
jgi:hypothetical protein